MKPVHRAEEAGDEGIDRRRIELGGRAALHDAAGEHGMDPVTDPDRLLGVVGHQQRRRAGLAQERQRLVAHLRPAARCRARRTPRRAASAPAPAPARGPAPPAAARRPTGCADRRGRTRLMFTAARSSATRCSRPAAIEAAEPEGDVLRHPQMREQGEILKHQPDPPALRRQAAAAARPAPARSARSGRPAGSPARQSAAAWWSCRSRTGRRGNGPRRARSRARRGRRPAGRRNGATAPRPREPSGPRRRRSRRRRSWWRS